jgi:hypothetical protein
VGFVHRHLERGVEGGVVGFFAAEIFLHEVFVHLDDLIEDGGVASLHGVEIGFAIGIEQAFDDGFAAAAGEIDREAFGAEGGADFIRPVWGDPPRADRFC